MTRTRGRTILPHVLLFGALCLTAHGVRAQEAAARHVDQSTGLRFPGTLSRLAYERVAEFGDSKLGYCVLYAEKNAHGQVCVYDFGHKNLPTGVDSAPFKDALGKAVDATVAATNRAPLSKGQLLATGAPSIEGDGKVAKAEMRLFSSEMALPDGTKSQQLHLILMTTGFGKFIKLNYTAHNPESDAFALETRQIVEDFVRYNGATMKQLLVRPSPAP
jgi:hypothetical protein